MARGVAGYMHPTLHVPAHEVLTAKVVVGKPRPPRYVGRCRDPDGDRGGHRVGVAGREPARAHDGHRALAGRSESVPRPAPVVEAGPGFFDTFGAQAQAGRLFTAADFAEQATPQS